MTTAALASQTYLPTGAEPELARVYDFLEAHAERGGVIPQRYMLIGASEGDHVELPETLYRMLRQAVDALAAGAAVTLAPQAMRLTTQQAAELLGVSRPTVVRLIDRGELGAERVGTRRRVLLTDVLDYRDRRREAQYAMLAATAIDLADEDELDEAREHLREARRAIGAERRSS